MFKLKVDNAVDSLVFVLLEILWFWLSLSVIMVILQKNVSLCDILSCLSNFTDGLSLLFYYNVEESTDILRARRVQTAKNKTQTNKNKWA